MLKKFIALILAAVLTAAVFVACEPKDNGEETSTEETTAASTDTEASTTAAA